MAHELRQNAILRRPVNRGADAHHGIGEQGLQVGEHHDRAERLHTVAGGKHPGLGPPVGQPPDPGRQDDEGHEEGGLQRRLVPFADVARLQNHGEGGEQNGVVGEGGEELGEEKGGHAAFHTPSSCAASVCTAE